MADDDKFGPQLERIKVKLARARKVDYRFDVFGADSHKYQIGPPLSHEVIAALEVKHGMVLPEDYRAFLIHVGHGSPDGKGAAAGPY